jgi:hypothetical protein
MGVSEGATADGKVLANVVIGPYDRPFRKANAYDAAEPIVLCGYRCLPLREYDSYNTFGSRRLDG